MRGLRTPGIGGGVGHHRTLFKNYDALELTNLRQTELGNDNEKGPRVIEIGGMAGAKFRHLVVDQCGSSLGQNIAGNGVFTILPFVGSGVLQEQRIFFIMDSKFTNNRAAYGGAISVLDPTVGLHVTRTIFANNIAISHGAAIHIRGTGTNVFEHCWFLDNFVVPQAGSSKDYTLNFYTGMSTYVATAWSIDEGDVYGLLVETCARGQRSSIDGIKRGLAPSWPGGEQPVQCDNRTSYERNRQYVHSIELTEGTHTLRVGVVITSMDAVYGLSMQGGWISIDGVLDPYFPQFTSLNDIDTIRYPGCSRGACPSIGEAFWIDIPITVEMGEGGAIYVEDQLSLSISGSVFARNIAASRGSAMVAISSRHISITNTSFDNPDDAVHMQATWIKSCAENPCVLGEACTYKSFSTFCEPCDKNTFGPDGVQSCTACPADTEPNAKHTACVRCPPGKESKIGMCTTCPTGKVGAGGTCSSCPGANQEPMHGATRCQCQAGFYNSSYGMVQCPDQSQAADRGLVCQPCGDCLDCRIEDGDHVTMVQPGFALGPAAAASYQGVEAGAQNVKKILHSCTRDMCIGESTAIALHLAVTVATSTAPNDAGQITYDASFEARFKTALATSLKISSDNISVKSVTSAAELGGLRRQLQAETRAVVAFAVAVTSEQQDTLAAKLTELRENSDALTTLAGGGGTALTSTLTQPTLSTYVAPGIRCRPGHDPSSPLCNTCTEGYVEGMDQMCFECNAEDASLSSEVRTLLLCVGIVVAIAAIFVVHRLYQVHAARGEQRDAGTMRWVKPSFSAGGAAPLSIYGKICISHYQILTQFRKPSQLPAAYAAQHGSKTFVADQPCSSTLPFPPSSRVGSTYYPGSPWTCTRSSVSCESYRAGAYLAENLTFVANVVPTKVV
jgi:hypothetical protein